MKKLLALVLALVMTLSLCVTSNAAFTDAADIEHDEAVNILSALGVINGKPGGAFDPKGTVTRAEMAKMITIVALGDVDVTAFQGTATDLKDINGHWAEAYIKYCYSQGVIAGKGAGMFDPNANVTTVEAAKMLLVALGYNAEVQEYTGASWAINVTRDAQLSGFYEDLVVASNAALTRDQAAQMIWNTVNACMIKKTSGIGRVDGKITDSYAPYSPAKTLLTETFKAEKKDALMTKAVYNSTDKDYDYSFAITAFGVTVTGDDVAGPTVIGGLDAAEDYSALVGHKVSVVYSTKSSNPVYGIYAEDTVVTSAAYHTYNSDNLATDKYVKIDGTKYDTDNNSLSFYPYNTIAAVGPTGVGVAATCDFIDFDADGKIDYAVYTPFTVDTVSYSGVKSFTLTTGGVNHKYTDTDFTAYEGVAKDDVVMIVAAANNAKNVKVITKLDVLNGKVVATNGTTKVKIGDEWIKQVASTMTLNDTFDYAVVNGFAVYTAATSATVKAEDYVLVSGKKADADGWEGNQVKLVYSDGTVEIKDYDSGVTGQIAFTGVDVADGTTDTLYTVDDKDNDGKVELYAIETTTDTDSDGKYGGFDGYTAAAYAKTGDKAGKVGTYAIADDAVVFVYKTTVGKTGCSVITGAELAKLSSATVVNAYYNTSKTTGYSEIVLAFVETNLVSTTGVKYGYVTGDVIISKNDDKADIATVTFWNGSETVTLNTDTDNDTVLTAKGQAFSYKLDNNGDMTEVTKLAAGAELAVEAYNGTTVKFDGDATVYDVDDDTVIIYVDTDEIAGVDGGAIQLANKDALNAYIKNVAALYDADNDITVLFVDIANDFQFVV